MGKFNRLICILILSLGITNWAWSNSDHQFGQFTYSINTEVPTWVEPIKPGKSKGKPSGQGEEYILVDTQVLAEPDNYQRYNATSTIFHTNQAVASGSEIHIYFNPEYQHLTLHEIAIIRDGKNIDKLSPQIVRLLQREEDLRNGIYDGVVTATLTIPGTRVGDRIESKYTITGRNPVFGEKVFGVLPLSWQVDVRLVNVRLIVPKDLKLTTRVHNTNVKTKKTKKGQFTYYTWQDKNIVGLKDDGDYPEWYMPYQWFEYSEFETWQEVEDWALTLYKSVETKSEELDKLVSELQGNGVYGKAYAADALRYVQENIRYLGIELGVNSHLPRAPTEVLSNLYGDCKDKSNLLVNLLTANGIEAYPVLVSHQYKQGVENFLPSPLPFDHVIVVAILGEGEVWLDPTKTFQGKNIDNLGFTYYGKGLVIGREFDDPVAKINPLPSQFLAVESEERYHVIDGNTPASLEITTYYRGAAAEYQRYLYSVNSPSDVQQLYLNFYAKLYPKITVSRELEFQDNMDTNVLSVREFYQVPELLKTKDQVHTGSFYASMVGNYLSVPQNVRRNSPISIGDPRKIKHRIIVDFEKDVGLYLDSTPILKKVPGFEFSSRSAYYSKRFEYKAEISVDQNWIDTTTVDDYVELANFIGKDIDFSLTFSDTQQKNTSESVTRLMDKLEVLANE